MSVLRFRSLCDNKGENEEKTSRNREKRECIRGVRDERAGNVSDRREVRDLRRKMGEKELGRT